MPSIKDVANYAGVSPATVSNVLNETKPVSEELRSKVREAVTALDYHVDFIASSMKRKNNKIIGVVAPTLKLLFMLPLINGIQTVASEHDYKLIFYSSDNCVEKEHRAIGMLAGSKVDGIILGTVTSEAQEDEYLHSLGRLASGGKHIPVVSVERDLSQYGVRSVHVDNVRGGEIATAHLTELGCKKIAVITGPIHSNLIQDRLAGYRNELDKSGIAFDESRIAYGDFTSLSGYLATRRLLADGIEFDGMFACNDEMAVGALLAFKESGISVPKDMKLIGFDNTMIASLIEPSLSTVNVPKTRLGSTAAKLLINVIEGNDSAAELSTEMPIQITVRSSTEDGRQTRWELEYW